jgi:hypothetical protein
LVLTKSYTPCDWPLVKKIAPAIIACTNRRLGIGYCTKKSAKTEKNKQILSKIAMESLWVSAVNIYVISAPITSKLEATIYRIKFWWFPIKITTFENVIQSSMLTPPQDVSSTAITVCVKVKDLNFR